MSDLILGNDWVGEVHQTGCERFGVGPSGRLTIAGALARNAHEIPDAPFLTEAGGGSPPLSYAMTHREVQRRVASLRRWRLDRGERVGILGHNSASFTLDSDLSPLLR